MTIRFDNPEITAALAQAGIVDTRRQNRHMLTIDTALGDPKSWVCGHYVTHWIDIFTAQRLASDYSAAGWTVSTTRSRLENVSDLEPYFSDDFGSELLPLHNLDQYVRLEFVVEPGGS